ncbi:DUF2182 domain-containing protein [Phenylobacterium terrae]|uniref:DUF2182 domain-containing protein n=1 Tax=Phenylobacterium terrae TaxID=2665495 RepID=A0ABW4N536_9CAUL
MTDHPALAERLARRQRAVVGGALALLGLLAWLYLLAGAGMGHGPVETTRLSLFPHTAAPAPDAMPGMDMPMEGVAEASPPAWSAGLWLLVAAMWWTMMVAMMSPSAAPAVLLYARVVRHAGGRPDGRGLAPTGAFAAGYFLAWLAFALAATAAQWGLEQSGLVASAMAGSRDRWFSAALLLAAGVYQLSPLQAACLSHCRSPAQFLTRHWRPGASGAVRLGLLHGAYCVGCCWALMALLFVGGVMNLAWIAVLSLLVLAEKVAPGGPWIGRAAGLVLIAWAALTLLV